jgi:beta-lactamase class A
MDWSTVENLAREAEREGGRVGVAVIAPDGERFSYRGDERFVAASTVKIPLMVEIYRQIDAGRRSLDDVYVLRDAAKAPGSGVLLHLHDGISLTLADLIYLMISISDNTATNILIDMADMEQVNKTIASLGMTGSTLGRKMLGRPAQGAERENWATPLDYARAVQSILDGSAASAASCARMTEMLTKQQNARRIARYLPEGVRWGSKTGSVRGVTNDAGFITTDTGTLIVSVFCADLADQHTGEQVIGDISRAAMRATDLTP